MNERASTPDPDRKAAQATQSAVGATPPATNPPSSTTWAADPSPHRYRVITCVMGVITYAYLTAKEVLALSVDDVDLHWDQVFGPISIRKRDGERIEFRWRFPCVGDTVGIPFLLDLMWAGAPLTVSDLIKNPKLRTLCKPDVRASRLYALRKTFADSAADPWYFFSCSQPYRAGWVLERSWRIVER